MRAETMQGKEMLCLVAAVAARTVLASDLQGLTDVAVSRQTSRLKRVLNSNVDGRSVSLREVCNVLR